MTQTMGTATEPVAHGPEAARVLRLCCGGCGGYIVVHNDESERHTRCPRCSERVKVVRSVTHNCANCGAEIGANLADGLTVAKCDRCGQMCPVGVPTAPVVRKHHRPHRIRSSARRPAARVNGIGLILTGALILLTVLAMFFLALS